MTTDQQHSDRQAHLASVRLEQERRDRSANIRRGLSVLAVLVLVGVAAFGLWRARPQQNDTQAQAPSFSLKTTAGTTVSLSDYRGKPVVLYFNEGAGCGSCTQQMAAIEKDPAFAQAGIIVLPVVMNTAAEIEPDLQRFGVKTPYLLDDGTVSKAYGVLGKGMHEGLPGHGFVLIDKDGVKRWQGDYPSMWLAPQDLMKEIRARL